MNAFAFNITGISDKTANPPGGTYVRVDGKLTGELLGLPAMAQFTSKLSPPSGPQFVADALQTLET